MNLENILVPALIVSHKNDKCPLTPANDSKMLIKKLENSRRAEIILFEGGRPPESKPCGPLSQHGFLGIENKVVDKISEFIKNN